jgi:hypothetical protein
VRGKEIRAPLIVRPRHLEEVVAPAPVAAVIATAERTKPGVAVAFPFQVINVREHTGRRGFGLYRLFIC